MKLLVKNRQTGETRPMTKASFELAGKKRGFEQVGTVEGPTQKSVVQQEMDRLRAEQKANQAKNEPEPQEEVKEEPKRRGPKPKKQQDEV